MTKAEEKDEVLNAPFPSIFNGKTVCSQGNKPPELVDRDREQNRSPALLEETVSNLLSCLDPHKSMRLDWIPMKVLRGWSKSRRACQITLHHLSSVLVNCGGSKQLEVSHHDVHVPEGLEGGSGQLQACQPDPGAREGYGTRYLECHHIGIGQDNQGLGKADPA